MENIVVSKLDKKDVKDAAVLVSKLANYTLDMRQDIFILNYENWEENLTQRLENKNFEIIVAKHGDSVVGVCSAEIKHVGDGENTKVRDILFIEYIVVKDEYKRNGIGTKFLDYMKKIAKDNDILSLELTVWGYNEGAIKFYEKNDMTIKRTIYEYKMEGDKK